MTHPLTVLGPHANSKLHTTGAPLKEAAAAVLMVHGRGAGAEDILTLAEPLALDNIAYLAPQAKDGTWYPYPFMMPFEMNEPWLSSALAVVGAALAYIEGEGVPLERVILLGFSQGACLANEYVARNARRYGGLVGLSGGLIGPEGTPRNYKGALEQTPVFLGCSDRDPHIPKARVLETAQVLEALGGVVDARIYPNMGHTINMDEIAAVREIIGNVM
ncbi:MAG TPA: dienelactone hydrolase family protein [Chloroflexia bacterium]|nr:dienelactone hydrolase family protein [Chloroflexia bacterium]